LGIVCIAQLPPGFDINTIPLKFVPFLNGKRVLTTQTFRDLFRSEVIKASEGIGVKNITLLFTDLKGSTELYERIGDLNAFSLVQRHFERLLDVTVRNNGAIIKTIGDAIMASFLKPADAVKAALAMRNEIAAFNAEQADRALILKIGIHTGPAIAVTLNDRLDYFGQNVNIAARIQVSPKRAKFASRRTCTRTRKLRRSSPRCRCNRPSRSCAACLRIFASFVSGAGTLTRRGASGL
jgi:class 3 adenylate cyclase